MEHEQPKIDNDCPIHGNSDKAKAKFWDNPLTSHWACKCVGIRRSEPPPHPTKPTWEDCARLFHDTYERLAPKFGYYTRIETREWNPDSNNAKLMMAVVSEALPSLLTQREKEVNQAGYNHGRSRHFQQDPQDDSKEAEYIREREKEVVERITKMAIESLNHTLVCEDQPCDKFRTTDHLYNSHSCPDCKSETLSRHFCDNCRKDHHDGGWRRCHVATAVISLTPPKL